MGATVVPLVPSLLLCSIAARLNVIANLKVLIVKLVDKESRMA